MILQGTFDNAIISLIFAKIGHNFRKQKTKLIGMIFDIDKWL